jgi:HTH-type transcriptional repressor of NAD biosynthesis genes
MYKIGITIGKFMPLHKGHELMIDFGAAMLDDLVIMVSGNEDDEIPLTQRYKWVSEYVEQRRFHNVVVQKHVDKSPAPVNVDDHGTVLDPKFQKYWIKEFNRAEPEATHIVSSDFYGQKMADLMGLEWLPVDPLRETVDISGIEIRNDPERNFEYISDVAKPYFTTKVAIVGPESTGKSTMTRRLAQVFDAAQVHEYGRTLSEAKSNDLTYGDFIQIM